MDSLQQILSDCDYVFRFDESRPQERAHEYLERRNVARATRDTAMQAAARDMVNRAASLPDDVVVSLDNLRKALCEVYKTSGVLLDRLEAMDGD